MTLSAEQLSLKDRGRIAQGYIADLVLFDPATVRDQALRQPWHQRGGHVKRFFSSFCYGHEKMSVAGDGERMYHARQFPTLSVPRNNSSCAVFRKEKDREFPPPSRLESDQLN